MGRYPKEVSEKISALQREINELKRVNNLCESVIDRKKFDELADLIDFSYSGLSERVSWLSRLACAGWILKGRKYKNKNFNTKNIRKVNEMTREEAEMCRKCADEIFCVLIRYAKIRASGNEVSKNGG